MSAETPALKNLNYDGKPKGASSLEKKSRGKRLLNSGIFTVKKYKRTTLEIQGRMQNCKTKKAVFIFT